MKDCYYHVLLPGNKLGADSQALALAFLFSDLGFAQLEPVKQAY